METYHPQPDALEDDRPMPIGYVVHSLELAPYCPGLGEDEDDWTDEHETTLREFSALYAEKLEKALEEAFPGRPVEVDVVHNTTGAGSGARDFEGREEDWIEEISNRVLARIDNSGGRS